MTKPQTPLAASLPSRFHRVWFALLMAAVAGGLAAFHKRMAGGPSDFAPPWYGAYAMLHEVNPYATYGPSRAFHFDWLLNYPATAFIAALPFGLLTEPAAAALFSALSAGLLAFGITRDSWDRSWIFFSASFMTGARVSQWEPLLGAAFFLPALGFVLVCKPNLGLAIGASTGSESTVRVAVVVGTLLLLASLAVLPTWPLDFWKGVQAGEALKPPILRPAGFLVALALLRWRQPEARLLFALACVPQTSSWYETLLPLLVARTKREMQIMVFASGIGYLMQIAFLSPEREIASADIGILIVVFIYLPALAIVLRRPNEGELPVWMKWVTGSVQVRAL